MNKVIKKIISITGFLAGLAVLAYFFYPLAVKTLAMPKILGWDNDQWVYSVSFASRYTGWPPGTWDHLWFEGMPRVLDTAFLHHYLVQPLVKAAGLAMAVKIYPLFWLGLFFVFSYLLFFRLSKSWAIALSLTLILLNTRGIYVQLYEYGVVLSFLSQTVWPITLFWLVWFGQTGSRRAFWLAAFFMALGLYSHGGLGLVFGFIPAVIFLLFCPLDKAKLFSWVRVKTTAFFIFITLGMSALGFFPSLLQGMGGGNYGKAVIVQNEKRLEVFSQLMANTNPALGIAIGLAVVVAIVFAKKQRPDKIAIPLLAILTYFLAFYTGLLFGVNPVGNFLFPGRSFWFFSLVLSALAAALLAPLGKKWGLKLLAAIIIIAVVLTRPLDMEKELNLKIIPEFADYKTIIAPFTKAIDQTTRNYRMWTHEPGLRTIWNIVSDVPQMEGYFHFYTKYSADWYSWLLAVISAATLETKSIPQDMAEKQALFLMDWYALKYLIPQPGIEYDLAPRFWLDNDYIATKSNNQPPAVLAVNPQNTSGIVEAVNVPIVGFVGSDDGYNTFLRGIGTLNLNTRYLIPLRLGRSVADLTAKDLAVVDLLIFYNLEGKNNNWNKIEDFVKNGGQVWIETGGNSLLAEGKNLPSLFPGQNLLYGSLGEKWEVEKTGELSAIDFGQLSPLVYRGEPWKVSYIASSAEVKAKAKILLTQAGKPVVVEQTIGQGKVLWTGLNFWYRPQEYRLNGLAEANTTLVLLQRLLPLTKIEPLPVETERLVPEKITVAGSGIKGVVLKENYLPGWSARVKNNGRSQSLAIYPAGPSLMFVPLPKDWQDQAVEVDINYRGPILHWVLWFVSLVFLAFAVEEIITNGFLAKKFKTTNLGRAIDSKKLVKKIGGWWDKDE